LHALVSPPLTVLLRRLPLRLLPALLPLLLRCASQLAEPSSDAVTMACALMERAAAAAAAAAAFCSSSCLGSNLICVTCRGRISSSGTGVAARLLPLLLLLMLPVRHRLVVLLVALLAATHVAAAASCVFDLGEGSAVWVLVAGLPVKLAGTGLAELLAAAKSPLRGTAPAAAAAAAAECRPARCIESANAAIFVLRLE
jgi:hypothetical protein